ncbi:cytochrome b [Aliidiomarina maris]|nr:cytochrome b N-terminal domain-containing protein [Aliidiomarina maris]MCL5050564.1 cytochrome b N-terminal domain-containing protein [Bacillota bacterium]RAJ93902.1 ubiquinol-cytochrome c reductase cytochrome b subunit [Aliidiomarina maris]
MSRLMNWIDKRLPVSNSLKLHVTQYPAPKNFNFWYLMGSLALVVLVNQIVTGIWLTMNYDTSATGAFASIEYIMRDVEYGWLLRYMHSTGASFFFIVVYLHMFRGLMYGSYQKPRELLWVFGMLIFLVLMAEAFMGYMLPWGQMSFWGAQVIISLFGAIPYVGDALTTWIRGDYVISGATLNRFFALHVIALPLVLVILVFLHIIALHEVGSNNPDGVDTKKPKGTVPDEEKAPFEFHERYTNKYDIVDSVPFHPYYTVKDIVGLAGFLILFALVLFFEPTMGGQFLESPNFEAADPMRTPEHIAPVWYFTPFYAILAAVPNAVLGVVMMFLAIVVLFLVPWLDRSTVRSVRYRSGFHKANLALLVVSFVILGFVGALPPTEFWTVVGRIFTFTYFAFFVLLFIYSKNEKTKPVPERVTK